MKRNLTVRELEKQAIIEPGQLMLPASELFENQLDPRDFFRRGWRADNTRACIVFKAGTLPPFEEA